MFVKQAQQVESARATNTCYNIVQYKDVSAECGLIFKEHFGDMTLTNQDEFWNHIDKLFKGVF